ncbi:MAG: hypothetical protein QOG13_2032 [Sphingomonadales bacterium]|jgi:hypothetical protein|nr:hypothetical protein [Sphingomonadales bacterium]MEA3044350.1 hypothetical protein [Sphingomonadales bacterium]
MKTRLAIAAFAALALAGCSRQPAAGGLTPDDERQLDNASAMLDDNTIFDVSPDSLVANEAEIAAEENAAAAGAAPANRSGNAQ